MPRALDACRAGCLAALLAVALSAAAFMLSSAALGLFGLEPTPPKWVVMLLDGIAGASTPAEAAALVVRTAATALLVAPVAEEMLFRGLLQRWLEKACGRRTAAWVLTAAAFAAAHASLFFMLPLFAVSLCFSRAKAQGGLAASILAHALYNATALATVIFA